MGPVNSDWTDDRRVRSIFDHFVGRFGKKPMHFFGSLGFMFFFLGFIILVYLSVAKLIYQEYGIADRPLFYFGILTLIVGTQLFVTGFLAELVSRNAPDRSSYLIEKRIGLQSEVEKA